MLKKIDKRWFLVFFLILFLVFVGLLVKKIFFSQSLGAISVYVSPSSKVFIDDIEYGEAGEDKPYSNDKLSLGEHKIKLVPLDSQLNPWEGKINLFPGTLTVIRRRIGESESDSEGEIIWLEKIDTKDKAGLTVVSLPDQAVVKINQEPKGFTPLFLEGLTPGSYKLTVALPGYKEREVSAKLVAGYKLIVNVQLAKEIEGIEEASPSGELITSITPTEASEEKATPTPTPTTKTPAKPYVRIKETPTGWLRVRSKPSTSGEELTKVSPGETFPYLKEEENGWYKIEYEEGKEGWVSGVYVDLIE